MVDSQEYCQSWIIKVVWVCTPCRVFVIASKERYRCTRIPENDRNPYSCRSTDSYWAMKSTLHGVHTHTTFIILDRHFSWPSTTVSNVTDEKRWTEVLQCRQLAVQSLQDHLDQSVVKWLASRDAGPGVAALHPAGMIWDMGWRGCFIGNFKILASVSRSRAR